MRMDFTKKRFLIVDDFGQMRSTLRHMLESFGVKDVDMGRNGREAVDLMSKHSYDVVLCDYNLGDGKDGQQVLEEAKKRDLIRFSTVFMLITAENTFEMVMGAVEYKPDDYLTKPFNKELLRSRLEKLIEKKSDLAPIDQAIRKKRFAHAIELCEERIAAKPRNLNELLKLKSDLCLRIGRYDDAAEVFNLVLQRRQVPWAQLGLGKVQFLREEYDEALATFRTLINDNRNFLEAYDWQARTLQKQGNPKEAQAILSAATQLSPKAVLRQQNLGELALRNEDTDTATRAFRKAVDVGRHSVYKQAAHYTNLARLVAGSGAGTEALKLLQSAKREFPADPLASFDTTVAESEVHRLLGNEQQARDAYQQAAALSDEVVNQLNPQQTLELAKAAFRFDDGERGRQLMQQVVNNHHEDPEVLADVQQAFGQVGLEAEGVDIIDNARKAVVALNNRGVKLAREGHLPQSIELFEEAARTMPANRVVNANAAQIYLMSVQQGNGGVAHLDRAHHFLDRVSQLAPDDANLQKLRGVFEKLVARAKGAAQ